MISDVIHISNDGAGVGDALAQAEKSAAFRELETRDALHLRLFAEEMLGMARSLTGEREGDFWIESCGARFQLHLKVTTQMNAEKRKSLLAASSTGKNAAAKGFMGKIKDLFERALEDGGDVYGVAMNANSAFLVSAPFGAENAPGMWTLTRYKQTLRAGNAPQEEWDELERSVISRLADEVEIGIDRGVVKMTVEKAF